MRRRVTKRPAETGAGVLLFGTVYGLLTQVGLDQAIAGLAAAAIPFVPGAISAAVDARRS